MDRDDRHLRDYVGADQHRIEADRLRGDKTIKVNWHEWGY